MSQQRQETATPRPRSLAEIIADVGAVQSAGGADAILAGRPSEPPARRGKGRPKRASPGARRFKSVSVELEPGMIEELDRACAAEGLDSRSEAIRQACRSYLRRAEKRLGPALTER